MSPLDQWLTVPWFLRAVQSIAPPAVPALEPAAPYPPITNRKSFRAAKAIARSKRR